VFFSYIPKTCASQKNYTCIYLFVYIYIHSIQTWFFCLHSLILIFLSNVKFRFSNLFGNFLLKASITNLVFLKTMIIHVLKILLFHFNLIFYKLKWLSLIYHPNFNWIFVIIDNYLIKYFDSWVRQFQMNLISLCKEDYDYIFFIQYLSI
jgi:hypothetical protein